MHSGRKKHQDPSKEEGFTCSEEAARLLDARDRIMREHSQKRREKIALGVFMALIIGGFIALTSYISAGHNLNVAATNIDDIAGDMTGYEVVLFEGTALEESEDDVSEGSLAQSETGASEDFDRSLSGEPPKQSGNSLFGGSSEESATQEASWMTVEEAADIYEAKNASVMELGCDPLRRYASSRIVMAQGHTFGIFSLTPDMISELVVPKKTTVQTTTTETETAPGIFGSKNETTTTKTERVYDSVSSLFASVDKESIDPELVDYIELVLDRFAAAKVDTVIALTPDPTPFCVIDGVDVVITFKKYDRFAMGETVDGTLYFDAPEVGEVGVLMIAPGNVVSTKVLSAD